MTQLLVITDLHDDDLFHTDPACDSLLPLVELAERLYQEPAIDAQLLVDAAAELGLLVESGAVAGRRWCRTCRAAGRHRPTRSAPVRTHALAA